MKPETLTKMNRFIRIVTLVASAAVAIYLAYGVRFILGNHH